MLAIEHSTFCGKNLRYNDIAVGMSVARHWSNNWRNRSQSDSGKGKDKLGIPGWRWRQLPGDHFHEAPFFGVDPILTTLGQFRRLSLTLGTNPYKPATQLATTAVGGSVGQWCGISSEQLEQKNMLVCHIVQEIRVFWAQCNMICNYIFLLRRNWKHLHEVALIHLGNLF